MNTSHISAKDLFDKRAHLYNQVSKWAVNEDLNKMSDEFMKGLSGRIALELGAGTGILISRVRNFERRIALDISEEMLSMIEDASIEKVVGNIEHLELPDECADLIICRQVLHYCDLDLALQNIKRVLRRIGVFHLVQVVDFENVPPEWDYRWASFRGVRNRKHLRTLELLAALESHSFEVKRSSRLVVNDKYSWKDFFLKHNIEAERESEVRSFFLETPAAIATAISLLLDDHGISYNRNVGFWLLKLKPDATHS